MEIVNPGAEIAVVVSTLEELAATANNGHALALEAAGHAISYSIAAGAALIEAKAQIPHGQWEQWIDANLDFTAGTARQYIRLATYRHLIPIALQTNQQRAMEYLRGLPGRERNE